MTDMARELGVSRQALSKRLEKDKIDLAFVRDPQTKQLTEAGIKFFREAYADRTQARKSAPDIAEETREPDDATATLLREAAYTRQLLEEQVANLRNQVAQLDDEKQYLRAELEKSHQREMTLLGRIPVAPSLPDPTERGLRAWWRRRHPSKG